AFRSPERRLLSVCVHRETPNSVGRWSTDQADWIEAHRITQALRELRAQDRQVLPRGWNRQRLPDPIHEFAAVSQWTDDPDGARLTHQGVIEPVLRQVSLFGGDGA